MRRLLLWLPLTITFAGCGTATTQDATANTASTNTTAVAAASHADTADSSSTTGTDKATTTAATATGDAATGAGDKPTYKVAPSELPPLPPQYIDLLKQEKVTSADLEAALKKATLAPPPAATKVPATAQVRLTTSQGSITVELNGKAAPLHVKSFLYLSQKGFFNGTHFHRYEPGFVIQGGSPLSKDPLYTKLTKDDHTGQLVGMAGPGYQIPREHNDLTHEKMVLAAARSDDPDSAGSQFYFTLDAATHLDQPPGYTVFGKVVSGEAVVLKLRKGDELKSVTVVK